MVGKMLFFILMLAVIAPEVRTQCSYTGLCRARLYYNYFNGTSSNVNHEICFCDYHHGCPDDWSGNFSTLQMFKARLFHFSAKLTADFLVCGDFSRLGQYLPACTLGNTTLTARVTTELFPILVRTWDCACPAGTPLFYKSITIAPPGGYSFISYICDSHKVICEDGGTECYTKTSTSISYPCECPPGFWCEVSLLTNQGYCSRL